jgi:hypothetical protein
MKLGRYEEDHNTEREDTPVVIEWAESLLNLTGIREASEYAQRELDIDFYAYAGDMQLSFENKIRKTEYDDVLIETISNMNKLTHGWIHTSKADYLIYVFVIDKTIKKGYIFDLHKLRDWWFNQGRYIKYPIFYGETPRLYKTQNVAVPEKDIPLNCVIYHPIYGLLKTIDGGLDESYFR